MTWTIDTAFPGANACGAALAIHDGAPAVSLAADPRHGPEALWFRFRLRRLDSDGPVPWLILRGVESLLGGGDGSALRPVARCEDGPWQRLERGTPLRRGDGRCDAAWRLPDAAAALEVAFCLPWDEPELDRLLADGRGRLRLATVGSSEGGRPLLRLANGDGAEGSTRPGVYILARQHAGETPGSWVLDGMLRRCAALGDAAPLAWAVPFVDRDGAAEGAYGKDRHPVDLNRSWSRMARRHEVHCLMRDVARWRARCAPRLCLDLHAPGALERDGCYAYTAIGGAEPTPAATAWAERLGAALGQGIAAAPFARVARYPSRWPSDSHPAFTSWATGEGLVAIALEISYQGSGDAVWLADDYRGIGARLADALADGVR